MVTVAGHIDISYTELTETQLDPPAFDVSGQRGEIKRAHG
jgi:hypothetical protein